MNKTAILYSLLSMCMVFLLVLISCHRSAINEVPVWHSFDQSELLDKVKDHDIQRMRYQLIQSKVTDKNDIWTSIADDISDFSDQDYRRIAPLVYEQDILSIQKNITEGKLTYEELTMWFLFRIVQFENDSSTVLNAIIALNQDAVEEARMRDRNKNNDRHPIYGMPILLKDNINTSGMPTTAGALSLQNNETDDAFIVKQLRQKGAIILGKVNLSEWAYFFCGGCPVGYSAIGGQTLNPYGRAIFETGGSSSGSGVAIAANFAVAAIGTETSGSILSPSGKNSLVGLKPTVGLASRSGIVPISSTLDTPGPMTKNVTDNAILLSAIVGEDVRDSYTRDIERGIDYLSNFDSRDLSEFRLGVMNPFLTDSLYTNIIGKLEALGANLTFYDPPEVALNGFLTLLEADMKRDLPEYLKGTSSNITIRNVEDVIQFNLIDTLVRAPYGQARLEGTVADTTSDAALQDLRKTLLTNGRQYFDKAINQYDLDAILSMNNRSAGYAAVAHYPCLTVPMGYSEEGESSNLTFIGKSETEHLLYQIAFAFERATKIRKPPF